MLKVKIKTEKPDMEGSGARGRLDSVLQGLVEKSDNSERDQNEDDPGKATADSLSKELSPSSAGKRPTARFTQHRRKKRKEMDDSIAESNQHKQKEAEDYSASSLLGASDHSVEREKPHIRTAKIWNKDSSMTLQGCFDYAYIIKLFDRSVDLAQFSTSTPLYPICRAWMRNNPTVRDQSASPSPPQSMSDEEVVDMINGKSQNVYRLPPPSTCPVNSSGEPVNLRIPPIVKSSPTECTDAVSNASLMYNHMPRWKKIRQKWKEASNKNQLRYAESIKVLKDMYDR